MNPSLSYSVGKYLLLPSVIFVASLIFLSRVSFPKKRNLSPLWLWLVIVTYGVTFGSMSILRYLSFHSSIFDLGLFDHSIWNIAYRGKFEYLASGHFSPVLLIYAYIYKVFPSPLILLLSQTLAISVSALILYFIAKEKLEGSYYAFLIVLIYLLYPPLEYNNLFDFHPDSFFIPLAFLAFYFLEKNNGLGFILSCTATLFLKEPLILATAMLGIFAIIVHKRYGVGSFILILSLVSFVLITQVIMPQVSGGSYGGGFAGSFSYLGENTFEIIKNLLAHPWILIKESLNVDKMGYLVFIFMPLMWIPLISPFALLSSLPALVISLLSRLPNYYGIHHQYTASVIPGLFISFVYALISVGKSHQTRRRERNPSRGNIIGPILGAVFCVSLYYNIILSPSPLSLNFWKKDHHSLYYKESFISTTRDRILGKAIKEHIPSTGSVSSQNALNSAHLAHRDKFYPFPKGVGQVDYVVVDLKRPHYIIDKINKKEFKEALGEIEKAYQIVFSHDGIYIFQKQPLDGHRGEGS